MATRIFFIFCLALTLSMGAWAAGPETRVVDGTVLVVHPDGRLEKIDLSNGETLWTTDFNDYRQGQWLEVEGKLYRLTDTQLVEVDTATGKLGEPVKIEVEAAPADGEKKKEPVKLQDGNFWVRGQHLAGVGWQQELSFEPTLLTVLGDGPLVRNDERMALYQANGELRFETALSKGLQAGPWVWGDELVVWQNNENELLAMEDGGRLRFTFRPGFPIVGQPLIEEDFFAVLKGEESDLAFRLTQQGRPRYRRDLPGRAAEGVSIVNTDPTLYLLYGKEEDKLTLRWLDEHGLLRREAAVGGSPLKTIVTPRGVYLFLVTTTEELKLTDSGEQIYDLKKNEPMKDRVLGYRLLLIDDGAQVDEVAAEPRQTLVGPQEFRDNVLLYATQEQPLRKEGERRKVNRRYPYEPVVLRGVTLNGQWEFTTEKRADEPSKDRLPDKSWFVHNEVLYLPTQDKRLLGVNTINGKLHWHTQRALKMDDGSPTYLAGPDNLAVMTRVGELAYLYGHAYSSGDPVYQRPLTPYFIKKRTNNLIGVILIGMALGYFIFAARRRELFIRRIAGLNALDEAVGRATEMGKPVLYVTGLADVDDIQTLASLSILGHVARKTAEYDTPILVPTSRAVVYSAASEVVKEAYTAAGRPDAFISDNVRYLTDDQFGYTAGIDGMMMREKPAANFYMGKFYAESLILAETGHATGAIQIAGTAMPSQLPFFVAACDYTLIGEELFAASAYLSKDPLQVGSLRGQDVGKAIVMFCLVLGALLITFDISLVKDWFAT